MSESVREMLKRSVGAQAKWAEAMQAAAEKIKEEREAGLIGGSEKSSRRALESRSESAE